jgi:hypothetical protein
MVCVWLRNKSKYLSPNTVGKPEIRRGRTSTLRISPYLAIRGTQILFRNTPKSHLPRSSHPVTRWLPACFVPREVYHCCLRLPPPCSHPCHMGESLQYQHKRLSIAIASQHPFLLLQAGHGMSMLRGFLLAVVLALHDGCMLTLLVIHICFRFALALMAEMK